MNEKVAENVFRLFSPVASMNMNMAMEIGLLVLRVLLGVFCKYCTALYDVFGA